VPVQTAETGRRGSGEALAPSPSVELLVLGAHLSGQPLNPELLRLGATLVGEARTAPSYRLWALPTVPAKPGLLRVHEDGAAVTGELWRLPAEAFGLFVAALPAPMTIGSVELTDDRRRPGFLVEPAATAGALDITSYGGWRQYLASSPDID
jgi:allophanate hydrolase